MQTVGNAVKAHTCVVLFMACCIAETHSKKAMDCRGVKLCGVLALESGFGSKNYKHPDPVVHGLWPQVPPYGNSQCIAPKESTATREKHYCYKSAGSRQVWFQNHEWTKHGICAGARNDDHFFDQVCDLSDEPLALMERVRDEKTGPCRKQALESDQEKCFLKIISEVEKRFPVYSVDQYNDQIMLSACAGPDGIWKIASPSNFQKRCGTGSAAPVPSPTGTVKPSRPTGTVKPSRLDSSLFGKSSSRPSSEPAIKSDVCYPMHSGPSCHHDSDCTHLSGCVRCARTRKCTDVLLTLQLVEEEPASILATLVSFNDSSAAGRVSLLLLGIVVMSIASLAAFRLHLCSRRVNAEEVQVDFCQTPEAEGLE